MSRVPSSFQPIAPGSLTSPAPAKVPGCQMPKTAPVGSVKTAILPRSITSIGSTITVPPASRTAAAVASASATET